MVALDTQNTKNKNFLKKIIKWFAVFATIFFIFIAFSAALALYFDSSYRDKIFPGISVSGISLAGKTQGESVKLLEGRKNAMLAEGISFVFQEKKFVLPSEILGSDPDLSKNIIDADIQKFVRAAYEHGRTGSWVQNAANQMRLFINKKNIPVEFFVDHYEIAGILKNEFKNFESPTRDAQLQIDRDDNLSVLPESQGKAFDHDNGVVILEERLKNFDASPIELELKTIQPKIFSQDAEQMIPKVRYVLNTTTPSVFYEKKTWPISKKQVREWLELQPQEGAVRLGFHERGLNNFFQDIAGEINVDPVDAKFELVDGRVTQFQISREGKKLNLEKSYEKINRDFFEAGFPKIELVVDVAAPKVATTQVNDLGIKDLLGAGKSNFSGSPKNRRLNIANGARLLNGLLVKPNEEFSLLKALRPFDGTNGYLPELVIKGDRTIPEFGGGLCQIGTTIFRAALSSGVKITERRNHSYRVRYYEPAGMDATIYEPSPDFKFINDTPGHILIMTEIQGDDLVFKFYGTSDGRVTTVPDRAKVYNIKEPGEPRYIETDELPSGEKKLVEKPHAGADTEFEYTIKYPDGREQTTKYTSHYVPWRETWLVGKSATTTPEGATESGESITNSFN